MKIFRILLVLLLLAAFQHAQYVDPPLDVVMSSNANAAPGLENRYNGTTATDTLITISFDHSYSKDVLISLSSDIIGLSPSVDGAACPVVGVSLMVARGTDSEHLRSMPESGQPDFSCNASRHSPPSRCDFDNDQCPEFEINTTVDYNQASVNFTFGNVSESVPFSSTSIEVPQNILSAMRDSSGSDNLTVSLSGNAVISYWADNQYYSAGECVANIMAFKATVPLLFSRSFPVHGTNHLFFLRAPILREQWFRNNRFDTIVLSEAQLYRATLLLNNNLSGKLASRVFNTIEDQYGLYQIISTPNLSSNGTAPLWAELRYNTSFTPTQLEPTNLSFSYIYEFNTTYSAIGPANLSIMVDDVCGGRNSFNDSFTSRMLSSNSVMENGAQFDPQLARPSPVFTEAELGRAELSIGLVAVLIILFFLNSWVK